MRVRVFLNREKDADGRLAIFSRIGGEAYRKGDKLERVYDYDFVGDFDRDRVLGRVYSDFNRGSPTFVGDDAYPERSLSAGDVVEVDGVRFAVERVGFKEVT
jgi:hypothetical protein